MKKLMIAKGRALRVPYVMPGPGWVLVDVEATGPVLVKISDSREEREVSTLHASRHATIGARFHGGERAYVRIDNMSDGDITCDYGVTAIEAPPYRHTGGCAVPVFASVVAVATALLFLFG